MTTSDELAILRVLGLYSHVADDQDADALAEVFTEDAVLTPTQVPARRGLAEIREYFTTTVPSQDVPTIAHHMTNPVVTVSPDGRTATARSKTIGVRADMGYITGEYRDELVKTERGWRISRRVIVRRSPFSTEVAER